MKLIYIAGPYRATTERGVAENIQRAEAVALEVWKLGAACICPHKNTAFFGGACPDETWLAGDLAMLCRCDALLTVDGWALSTGARWEVEHADGRGLPVFHKLSDLERWLIECRKAEA